jgi:hypothetical protein
VLNLPVRKKISKVLRGRYPNGIKPLSWDQRVAGIDVVIDDQGSEIPLFSHGDQSTPQAGWEILITGYEGDTAAGPYTWTLYGVAKS